MKKKPGFDLHEIGDTFMITADGSHVDFTQVINLNETAAYIWQQCSVGQEVNHQELVDALMKEYEVDESLAQKDVHDLLLKWVEIGLFES
ncbi:MAG TPA: PqqD family protein [Bacteroidaceae bacterium]|nr:PqqD family protein [Bacteroidaceae bacterium]